MTASTGSRPPSYTLQTTPESLARAKLVLRAISIAFCVVLVGLGVKLRPVPGAIVINLVPACVTIAWDVGLIIASFFRRGRDVSAGLRVGIDLLIWLGFGALAILMAFMWGIWGEAMGDVQYDQFIFALTKVTVFVSSVQVFIRLPVFIIACHETHVRKQNARLARKLANL